MTVQVQKVLKCGIITLDSLLGLGLRVLICSEKEVERATGNLDFTGFLGLKKYL